MAKKFHLGHKLKIARSLKGLTQEELAQSINKTRALISHIEQTGVVNHDTLKSILLKLDVTEEDLELLSETRKNLKNIKTNEAIIMELKKCRDENEMLKELVASQKKTIALLEGQMRVKKVKS